MTTATPPTTATATTRKTPSPPPATPTTTTMAPTPTTATTTMTKKKKNTRDSSTTNALAQGLGDLHLDGAAAGDDLVVLDAALHHVESVPHRAVRLLHELIRAAAQDQRAVHFIYCARARARIHSCMKVRHQWQWR